jgi:hypothetical protein
MGLGYQIELGLQRTAWLALSAMQRLKEAASLRLQQRVRVGIIDRSSKVAPSTRHRTYLCKPLLAVPLNPQSSPSNTI